MNLGNAKFGGDLDLCHAGVVKATDFADQVGVKFGIPMIFSSGSLMRGSFFAEDSERVKGILGWRDYLKILKPVVVSDSVFMIDLHSFWNRADEGGNNEAMNGGILTSLSGAKVDKRVPMSICIERHDVPALPSQPAKAGNAVSVPAGDISPSFFDHGSSRITL